MVEFAEADDSKLPFPTRPLKVQGGTVEEYMIPDEKKEEVLKRLYPFVPVPSLDEEKYDLHEGKLFQVREFRVTREGGKNLLVSLYYPSSGGSVFVGWVEERNQTIHLPRLIYFWRLLRRGVYPFISFRTSSERSEGPRINSAKGLG